MLCASAGPDGRGAPKVRVLRIIARLNVGGPAQHVSILSGRLNPARYDTLLLAGALGPGEGSLDALAERNGATVRYIEGLGPELTAAADARAVTALIAAMRAFRPQIVHTHTAKAGALGRLAARLALGHRPIVVHTYHGHVLSGYFGPVKSRAFRAIERGLAATTDQLVGVSQATIDDLVSMGIAPATKFAKIPVGLDLDGFLATTRADGAPFREEVGAGPDDVLALFVGRLAPIKRVDLLLDAVAAAGAGTRLRLAIVGDGPLRAELEARSSALGLGRTVTFCGFRADVAAITGAADLAVLSSDNEGTPVALIEAAAAARPALSTDVGGVAEIVRPSTGVLVARGDAAALGRGLAMLATNRPLREQLGAAARLHVAQRFRADRLLRDVDELYATLLARRSGDTRPRGALDRRR
jgi:glycosyltransferase involved in cell wall biosynthesis